MTSTANSIKQRKLSDLRVIDLQRELRSFNISYDKKELKGALIEKLRQALIDRNLDPDNYLFDASTDLKSISSDENNRNLEENGSNEITTSEMSTMETESDQQLNLDYPVQTNSPNSSKQTEGDNEPIEQIDRLNSRETNNNDDDDDDENIFLTIDQSTTKQDEDENNNHNDTIERNFTEQYQTSNKNFDQNSQSNDINPTFNNNFNDQQISNDQQHVPQTTNLFTDNDNLTKSENDQSKSKNINKDQCHLWVSNIAKETHASHLKDLFSKYGKVLTTKVIGSSSSRWFGYINLATPDDVEKCINALHQTELHGKKIYVDREMHDEPIRSSVSSSSNTHRKPADEHSSSSNRKRDSSKEREKKSSNTDMLSSSTKRSSSNDNRKKISSPDTNRKPFESNNQTRTSSSSSSSGQQSRSQHSTSQDKQLDRSKSKTSSSPSTYRSHSRERADRHRSTSIDQSKKYEKSKDTHRSHYDKDVLERKQYVQHQEEKIKEEQRRLAEERDRMRREYELLERERLNIERTRAALQKEKQDQAREIEKQRRLADEVKHRHEIEDKIRDEKLQRLAHNDNKRPRSSSHRDSQRSHHSNTTNNNSNSNKGYDHRSSSSSINERDRDRSLNERNRDYYPEPKRQYTEDSNNQREPIFRDRPNYRDSDLSEPSSSNFSLSSSSSINNNQRYMPSTSNQHRASDPFGTIPLRGRDTALPPSSSVSTAYDRSSRNASASSTNPNAIPRRPHSRERFDNREYLQQAQRRDRSPIPSTNTLRRDPIESSHWDRSKSRDAPHYNDDGHKYLPSQYLSDSSQSSQQQGLWSAAPPSRQAHHHSDLSGKTGSHAPIVDPYSWQRVSQQGPPQSHHPSSLSSSHDRSRNNIPSNQRIPILPSSQPPPPPPPSSRGNTTGQTHLYSHPGVPLNTLPTSQQHASLAAAAPPSLRHPTTYLTQQTSPTGLVLHPTGQTRPYEQHYVVAPSLSQRRF